MIWVIIGIVGAVLLSGLSVVTGAEFEQQVKAAERWLLRLLLSFLPAREVGEPTARRTPPGVENLAPAGGAPGADGDRLSPAAPRAARTSLVGPPTLRTCCLTVTGEQHTPECDEEAAALPVYAAVMMAHGRHARSWPREFDPVDRPFFTPAPQDPRPDVTMSDLPVARPCPDVLPITGAPGGCTGMTNPMRALGLADLGPAGAQDRTLAERVRA